MPAGCRARPPRVVLLVHGYGGGERSSRELVSRRPGSGFRGPRGRCWDPGRLLALRGQGSVARFELPRGEHCLLLRPRGAPPKQVVSEFDRCEAESRWTEVRHSGASARKWGPRSAPHALTPRAGLLLPTWWHTKRLPTDGPGKAKPGGCFYCPHCMAGDVRTPRAKLAFPRSQALTRVTPEMASFSSAPFLVSH